MNTLRRFVLSSFGLFWLPCMSPAQSHMQIVKGSKLLGYATVSQWMLADGGKTVEMRMKLLGASKQATELHKVSTYDAQGHPRRMVLEIVGGVRSETICTFDSGGAHVSRVVNGVAKNSTVPRAENAPWGDASEFWFLRDKPKPGTHFRTLLFSLDKADWTLTELSYLGQVNAPGYPTKLNAIVTAADGRSTTAYVDDHGDPVRVELEGGVVMAQIVANSKKAGLSG